MFEIRDDAAGLAVSLTREPHPRDPRLVEDSLFQIATWDAGGLGDPHDWPSREAFMAAMSPDRTAIFAVVRVESPDGPYLVAAGRDAEAIAGYAFATHERLCLHHGLEAIGPGNRARVMEDAEYELLGELLAYEDYVGGHVFRYEVRDRVGRLLEARRDLYGEDYARHLAQEAFDRHLVGVG